MAYELPKLPYAYNALEPHIDARTMEIHHSKHHQAYITKANEALKGSAWEQKSVEEVLRSISDIPENIRTTVQNNAGGHANHSLFWTVMQPNGANAPQGAILDAINKDLGGLEKFKELFTTAATTRFGSGWAWLSVNTNGTLLVENTANQDSPLMNNRTPILGLDVWEHAYYLNYQNKRPDYIAAFFNVINWDEVARRFEAAQ